MTGMTLETFAFVEPYLALAIVYWLLVEATAVAWARGRGVVCAVAWALRHERRATADRSPEPVQMVRAAPGPAQCQCRGEPVRSAVQLSAHPGPARARCCAA
ncbi:MAG: hypothetical protein WDN49_21160 [Acetobacteraceae bacterium]